MTAHIPLPPSDQAVAEFERELESVQDKMHQPVHALRSPLRELIMARIESSYPPARAAVVLCAGYSVDQNATESRVNLAAALEMLTVAFEIHERLLGPDRPAVAADPGPEERTYLGGNILAGDFCFSCAAQLAARTESPAVVATFATALQTVSENRLRTLFLDGAEMSADPSFSTHRTLMHSGAAAALELSDLEYPGRVVVESLIDTIVEGAATTPLANDEWKQQIGSLPAEHASRWKAYASWIRNVTPDSSPR